MVVNETAQPLDIRVIALASGIFVVAGIFLVLLWRLTSLTVIIMLMLGSCSWNFPGKFLGLLI